MKTHSGWLWRLLTLLLLCTTGAGEVLADSSSLANYACGMHSVYAALRFINKPITLDELMTQQYISTCTGSTIRDLARAVENHGGYSLPIENLDVRSLGQLECPAVLNVKSGPDSVGFDHWVLYLPAKDGRLRVFDAPGAVHEVSARELPAMWSGVALLVSDEPISASPLIWQSCKRLLPISAILAASLIAARILHRKVSPQDYPQSPWQRAFTSCAHALAILLMATTVALVFNFLDDSGFLNQNRALAVVEQAHFSDLVPRITVERAKRLSEAGAVFIDARMTPDYESGHIPGAVNVPAGTSAEERQHLFANISKQATLVIYCQSRNCLFADRVAKALSADGFSDLMIMPEGWLGWSTSAK